MASMTADPALADLLHATISVAAIEAIEEGSVIITERAGMAVGDDLVANNEF